MTVFVVQNQMRRNATTGDLEPLFDLTPAREYGQLEFLLTSGPVPLEASAIAKTLCRKLQGFDPEVDYLLAVGNPVAIAAASAVVSDETAGVIPMLVWDRHTRRYNAVRININGE